MGGCGLWFDMERAKTEEKRSRLAKAFSRLFKRKPKAVPQLAEQAGEHGDVYSVAEWSDIPLYSLSIADNEIKEKVGKNEFGSSCKKFFGDLVKKKSSKKSTPATLGQTIPKELQKTIDTAEDVSMAPIKSQVESSTIKIKAPSTPKDFQKLAVEQWRRDQKRMFEGTFPFPPGFMEKYQIEQVMGEGSFGFVTSATRLKDDRLVAVKWALREKIPPKHWNYDPELGLVPSEVYILRQLAHPSIIQLLEYFDNAGEYVCLVSELHGIEWTWPCRTLNHAKNIGLRPAAQLLAMKPPSEPTRTYSRRAPCDLFECIECHSHLPERTIYKIFSQILDAVIYMRDAGWLHRDLKDENIVVDEDYRVKLVDFGSAAPVPKGPNKDDKLFKQFNGTLAFAAPEIIKGVWYEPLPAEVWSLGILLFTMAYKKAPFTNTEQILMYIPEELKGEDGTGLNDLILRLLDKDSSKRIDLDSILTHSWMQRCRAEFSIICK